MYVRCCTRAYGNSFILESQTNLNSLIFVPIRIFAFQEGCPPRQLSSLECIDALDPAARVWIDVFSEFDEELKLIAKRFPIHELSIEDCLTPGHLPKIEFFDHYTFVITRALKTSALLDDIWKAVSNCKTGNPFARSPEHGLLTRKVAMFISPKFLITYRRFEVPAIESALSYVLLHSPVFETASTDRLAFTVLDILLDRSMKSLNYLDKIIQTAEDQAVISPSSFNPRQLIYLKHQLGALMHIMVSQHFVLNSLTRETFSVTPTVRHYFLSANEASNAATKVVQHQMNTIDGLCETLSAASMVQARRRMIILASIIATVMPLKIITGLFKMHFDFMPLVHNPYGFYLVLTFMLPTAVGSFIIYLRRALKVPFVFRTKGPSVQTVNAAPRD